jgi:Fe2+ or Zn2+ uptake regulation protein
MLILETGMMPCQISEWTRAKGAVPMTESARRRGTTRRKDLVAVALRTATTFVTVRELHDSLSAAGSTVGTATVYRHLHRLVNSGEAETVQSRRGQLFRAAARSASHLHARCDDCGLVEEIETVDFAGMDHVVINDRFEARRYVLEVFGTCGDCASEDA